MFNHDYIEVRRECDAYLIPAGTKVSLQKGALVVVTQALGTSYTVYVNGNLARIDGKDGDALGLVIMDEPSFQTLEGPLQDKLWALLKTCYDPEIPVNIVDLGLVYSCEITDLPKKSYSVAIKMTLTAPACGMGPVLVADIEQKLRTLPEVADFKVDLVFDPPWDRNMMTEAARLQLGLM